MIQTGTNNLIVAYLQKKGFEVTQENYLSLAYPDVPPDEITPEMEQEWADVESEMTND